ncbi:MAG TPA: MazG-like family protein [Xanthobacteraceae bacterium]|nr:MazG-like family protein [Xanthobacteraceae bacterium]
MPSFKEFSRANLKRCESAKGFKHSLYKWDVNKWFVAIMGELGEAANVVKKLNREEDGIVGNKQTDVELQLKLRHEMADAFIYLDLTAQRLGFNIFDAAVEVFDNKSAEIGYPVRLKK